MPWRESCAMDERMRFIVEHMSNEWTMTELCERFGISRKTGYKWLERYLADGPAGLSPRPRAPASHGRATPEHVVEAIVGLRRDRPSWGPRKIIGKLVENEPGVRWPRPSTAGEILKRAGLTNRRRVRGRAPPRLGELTVPQRANHVWGVDHKGWILLGDGSRVEPLTMTDGFSRYLISLSATSGTTQTEARPLFERAFRDHGLPEIIRSDNGAPFASTGAGGLTRLSAWWLRLGVRHERIDAGHPQQNGRHERFHLTLLEAMQPPEPNRAAQARRFQAFARDYNEERPHEALGQRPPASLYRASPRKMPERLPEPDYGDAAVRRVRHNGEIKWRGELVFISSSLVGEAVGVEETATGDEVRFCDVPLGVIDLDKQTLRKPAPDKRRKAHKTKIET